MRTLGLVEIVRQLPPPTNRLANTALQIRIWGGFGVGCQHLHVFALDDALACTLEPGKWVAFKYPLAKAKLIGPLELVHPDDRFRALVMGRDAHEQIAEIRKLLQPHTAEASASDLHGQACEVYNKLEELHVGFGPKAFPTELLKKCFKPAMAKRVLAA